MNSGQNFFRNFGSVRRTVSLWTNCSRAAIAIEFALVVPIAVVLLLGTTEASRAISQTLVLQSAARAGLNFGLIKPPIQGNLDPVVAAVRANLPADWNTNDASAASVSASMQCECEFTGAISCGGSCAVGERTETFLKISIAKPYAPLLKVGWMPAFNLTSSSTMRLQ
jgi:hypothetical protein